MYDRKRGPKLRNLSRAPRKDPSTRQQRRYAERQAAGVQRHSDLLRSREERRKTRRSRKREVA